MRSRSAAPKVSGPYVATIEMAGSELKVGCPGGGLGPYPPGGVGHLPVQPISKLAGTPQKRAGRLRRTPYLARVPGGAWSLTPEDEGGRLTLQKLF